jgi:uncharacterized protein with NAD-binding domain and iron-sulfur cluster
MGGIATAWRLSEPGWRDELDSITVYQRGWRLGGKGASSRGAHGRIEEHGLHLWLGYYENAFRLLRECYAELDRPTTDPRARIQTWRQAMVPTAEVGLEDRDAGGWHHWIGRFTRNDQLPGDPDPPTAPSVEEYARRALRLVADFLESLPDRTTPAGIGVHVSISPAPPRAATAIAEGAPVVALAGVLEALARLHTHAEHDPTSAVAPLDRALAETRTALTALGEDDADVRRTWHLVSVMTACVRGVIADGLFSGERSFRDLDDEDFLDWCTRHGAAPAVADFAFIRGLYDLVFAERGEDRSRRGVGAGVAVFMTAKMFFEYRGAIFWKMTAGMGDVVFAPAYQALRERGVRFELFHRVDELHVSEDGLAIEAITMGRQARVRDASLGYEPLVRVGDLPTFPPRPLADQLLGADGIEDHDLESHWCRWPDVERRRLRRGEDFDVAVFAVPIGMAAHVCRDLIEARPEWRAMVANVPTTATQALQLWFRTDEPSLGWVHPGSTVSAFSQPFNTWASMDQLIPAECWPEDDRPGAIGYFCGALDADWPIDDGDDYPGDHHRRVRDNARHFVHHDLAHLLPGTREADGPRWDLLCGNDGQVDDRALDTQYLRANVDPSDRYVMCSPGSDRYRLRSDESGFDNLFLAGDWTDNGLNAGCIEAATLSGLQAANAVLGRPRMHRIAGTWQT